MKRNKTVQAIADGIGYTRGHVSQVLHGKRRHRATEEAIARAIGKSVGRVFGRAA